MRIDVNRYDIGMKSMWLDAISVRGRCESQPSRCGLDAKRCESNRCESNANRDTFLRTDAKRYDIGPKPIRSDAISMRFRFYVNRNSMRIDTISVQNPFDAL